MSVIGISTNGDLVTSEGIGVSATIEIHCTDPNFLERAERKRPHVVTQFVGGFFSALRDWGIGVNFCIALLGIYGPEMQQRAKRWGSMILQVTAFAWQNPELAYRIISVAMGHTFSKAVLAGRLAGGITVSGLMLTGGRYGAGLLHGKKSITLARAAKRSSALVPANYANGAMALNLPVMGMNFVLAITGAAVMTIKRGNNDIASIFNAVLTGDYDGDYIGHGYKAIFQQAQAMDVTIDPEEIRAMLAVVEAIEECINSPDRFGNAGEVRETVEQRRHVPIGQVSSARPDGMRGSIEQGMEYNALDAISENRERAGLNYRREN